MIQLITSGTATSIQDDGRIGSELYGVPMSGTMDRLSAHLANEIVNNETSSGLLEFTVNGPILQFHKTAIFTLTGAHFSPMLNSHKVNMFERIQANPGDILKIGQCSQGRYGYMAIRGGIKSPVILNSQSMYQNITPSSTLKKNDVIALNDLPPVKTYLAQNRKELNYPSIINATKGPEFSELSTDQQQTLFKECFSISNLSNRMAYQLEHKRELTLPDIISSPVQPGTVQLTPNGDLIVLMRDAQTTGGYARILQLSASAINTLAQLPAGNSAHLNLIETNL
jgi:biotin-dependent carboxylase-like uncharacterized protein